MLDVHVAASNDTRREWLEQCIYSVQDAIDHAGFAVHLHVVDAHPGHIGLARRDGFNQGSSPFVTFVDDDDYLAPHAFACLAPALALVPRLLFTAEHRIQNGKPAGTGTGHHLAVMRREDAITHDWANYPAGGEGELYARLGAPVQLSAAVYFHRIYRSKGRALREQYSRRTR